MTTPTAATRIRAQIDLPVGVATWVFAAHVVALFSPLVISWQAMRHADALERVLDAPFMLHIAVGFFLLGSAFEIAQNTVDRWYYEGPYPAFCDLLFNTFIALGLGALGLAAGVDAWWVVLVVGVAAVAFPVLYLKDQTPYPATGVLAIVAVALLYDALRDPAILLLLLFTTGLNLYFLVLVVRTKAQSLHGAIALTNGLGLLWVPFAIDRSMAATPTPWSSVAIVAAGITATALVAWRPLRKLSATPRGSKT